jgi:hypothetical protein
MSDISEILIIWHFRREVPRPEVSPCTRKNASVMKQAGLRDMVEKVSESVFTPPVEVSPNPLSPSPSTSSALKLPQNTEKSPNDREPTHEEDILL